MYESNCKTSFLDGLEKISYENFIKIDSILQNEVLRLYKINDERKM